MAYILQVALASWRTMIAERLSQGGFVGYVAIWVVRPIFELTLAQLNVRAAIANIGLQRGTMEDAGRAAFGLDPLWPMF